MRFPRVKVWRAFPELDHLGDAECISLCRRVIVGMAPWRGRILWLAGLCSMLASLALTSSLLIRARAWQLDIEKINPVVFSIVLAVSVMAFAVGYIAARDLNLYLLIRGDLHRARCRKCGQSLIGLRVIESAINPNTPGDARVRCPECGKLWTLLEIGLTPRDLIPYEERHLDGRIGTLKRTPR